jgi:hypothetical protein
MATPPKSWLKVLAEEVMFHMTKPPLGWSEVPKNLTIKRVEETMKVTLCDVCGDKIDPKESYGECKAVLFLPDEVREGTMEYHERCQPPQIAGFLGIATRRHKPDSDYETAPRPEPPPETLQPRVLEHSHGPSVPAEVARGRRVERIGGADCEVNPLTEGAEGRT